MPSTMKLLFLDTSALFKLFVTDERGHDVLMWLLNGLEPILIHSVLIRTSVHVRDEFLRMVEKKVKEGRISPGYAKGILGRATGRFDDAGGRMMVDRGTIPDFRDGKQTSAEALMQKHGLKHRDRTDCAILASIVNYLRGFVGGSLPHVVTADKAFAKVIKAEGFGVINPEKMSIEEVKAYLAKLR